MEPLAICGYAPVNLLSRLSGAAIDAIPYTIGAAFTVLGVLITVRTQRWLEEKKHVERARSNRREKLQELYEAAELYYNYQVHELSTHLVMITNEKIFSYEKNGNDELIAKVMMLSELWFPELGRETNSMRNIARESEEYCAEIRHKLLQKTPITKEKPLNEIKRCATRLNAAYALFSHGIIDLFRKNLS